MLLLLLNSSLSCRKLGQDCFEVDVDDDANDVDCVFSYIIILSLLLKLYPIIAVIVIDDVNDADDADDAGDVDATSLPLRCDC